MDLNSQNQERKPLHHDVSTASANHHRSSSPVSPPPTATATAYGGRRSHWWSVNMSRSSHSLMDEVVDPREEQFISSPGKWKSDSMRSLEMLEGQFKKTDIDDVNDCKKESLHMVLDSPCRSAKGQKQCRSLFSSVDSKRPSLPFMPLNDFSIAGRIQENSSSATIDGAVISYTEDEIEDEDVQDINPLCFLSNEGISTSEERHTGTPREPVLGLPKLKRSHAIRDPVELAKSIDAMGESLKELR